MQLVVFFKTSYLEVISTFVFSTTSRSSPVDVVLLYCKDYYSKILCLFCETVFYSSLEYTVLDTPVYSRLQSHVLGLTTYKI